MKVREIIIVALMLVLIAGCGNSQPVQSEIDDNPHGITTGEQAVERPKNPPRISDVTPMIKDYYNGSLPITAVIDQVYPSSKTFEIVIMPTTQGQSLKYAKVIAESATIKNKKGLEKDFSYILKNQTVKINGKVIEGAISASTIDVLIEPIKLDLDSNYKAPKNTPMAVPLALKELLMDKLPIDFAKDWIITNTSELKDRPGVRALSLENTTSWQITLIEDKNTTPLYEVSLSGPNDFKWFGYYFKDGKISSK